MLRPQKYYSNFLSDLMEVDLKYRQWLDHQQLIGGDVLVWYYSPLNDSIKTALL